MIIYNSLIPFKGYLCMNLFGILFVRKELKDKVNQITINHEGIHSKQMKETLFIGFYLLYLLEFICRLVQYGKWHKAYRNISFEREAYDHEKDTMYVRRPFAWLTYIKSRS